MSWSSYVYLSPECGRNSVSWNIFTQGTANYKKSMLSFSGSMSVQSEVDNWLIHFLFPVQLFREVIALIVSNGA